MKTGIKILGIITILIGCVGCSSVKVVDGWEDKKMSDLKNKSVLVINKTEDNIVRATFENNIVELLSEKGYKSLESYKMFPSFNLNEPINDSQLSDFKKELKQLGIHIILMTSLKDVKTYTETSTHTTAHIRRYPLTYYRRGFYSNFYSPYQTIYLHPVTEVTSSKKEYILETQVFDLTEPENEQLLAATITKIDNPKTLQNASKDFSKRIVQTFIK